MTLHRHLPRLTAEHYQGQAWVHWIFSLARPVPVWLDDAAHAAFRECLLHTLVRHGALCPAYCLMPDHIHLFWVGLAGHADAQQGAAFFRRHMEPRLLPACFQKQSFDHVLRAEDRERGAFPATVRYVLANARPATYDDDWRAWPYVGALAPGYPDLDPRAAEYWDRFWSIYERELTRTAMISA